MSYTPPFTITSNILNLVSKISETIGQLKKIETTITTPQLRKINRIKTLVGTLQIEGNTLDEERMTALLEGKRVLGTKQEITEAKGAIKVYNRLESLKYDSLDDLLEAHRTLMDQLLLKAGSFRMANVGVGSKSGVVHVAPPYDRVPELMYDLFAWLKETDVHPLIVSCVFHYEFEFIHPFEDGNGRVGRLWQTLILYHWKALFAYMPLESVVREKQYAYYEALEASGEVGESTPFIEFMLGAILETLENTPQATPQDTPQDERLQKVLAFCAVPKSRKEIQEYLGMKDRKHFKEVVLDVLLRDGYLEMTLPEKPQSPKQKYRVKRN
jgi:Fic family protein